MKNKQALDCPFCAAHIDINEPDVLYPSGIGWMNDENLEMLLYCKALEVPEEQWCYKLVCPNCAVEMHGDSKEEALVNWNRRKPNEK